ncbi:hypothetical protein CCACVL1_06406 [Corchorus capsularis]|uniref:Uncharacterized protein n=1 Tax=Corchorus capsularis TaxID=210143 RepID=A0A1R3JFN6_COCAP|nr:hypothetical protein CCACVL1_06406 [Corchorus capsularis]
MAPGTQGREFSHDVNFGMKISCSTNAECNKKCDPSNDVDVNGTGSARAASGVQQLRGAEARGPFCCPRMVNCTEVCQGFPSHCDGCNCICGGAADEAAAAAATINTSPLPIN